MKPEGKSISHRNWAMKCWTKDRVGMKKALEPMVIWCSIMMSSLREWIMMLILVSIYPRLVIIAKVASTAPKTITNTIRGLISAREILNCLSLLTIKARSCRLRKWMFILQQWWTALIDKMILQKWNRKKWMLIKLVQWITALATTPTILLLAKGNKIIAISLEPNSGRPHQMSPKRLLIWPTLGIKASYNQCKIKWAINSAIEIIQVVNR